MKVYINFRKYFSITLRIVPLFVVLSCSDVDFLDRYPRDKPSPNNFLVDEQSAKQLVIAAYHPWIKEPNMFGKELLIQLDALSDDSDIRMNNADRIGIRDWTFMPNNSILTDWWRYAYQSINAANYAIQQIPNLEEQGIAKEKLAPYIAEARFIRAYDYLFLVTFWGEVPLVLTPLSSFEEFSQPKADVSKIYDQIIEDFLFAKSNLPKEQGSFRGSATQASAAAFLSKSYLYKKDYDNCEKAAREAISIAESSGYKLVDDYESIFSISNEANPELLFYFSFERNSEKYGQIMSVERNVRLLPGELYHIQGGEGWGYALPTRDLYESFEKGDSRRKHTILAPGDNFGVYNRAEKFNYQHRFYTNKGELVTENVTYQQGDTVRYDMQWSETGMNVKKLTENLTGLTNVRFGGLDIPVMRMADLYLILAETLAEKGNSEALTWVNKVRARKSVNLPPKEIRHGSLVDIVRHERRVELAMEGQRIWDLFRWGKIKETFGDGNKVKLHFFSDYLSDLNMRYRSPVKGLSRFSSELVLLPIPQYEMDQNNQIFENNLGY